MQWGGARKNKVVQSLAKKISEVVSRAKRINEIWEEQTDYIYCNKQNGGYFSSGISKCLMKTRLREVNPQKALIISSTGEDSMFCSKPKEVIEPLIENIEQGRIREFREVDKHCRTCYQLYFHDEPDRNHYMVIDYEGG